MTKLMEYKGYHANIYYDADDELFVGEVIGLADSLSFHGTSVQEMQERFASCIEDYYEFCRENGVEPEKEYSGLFNVRVSPEVHRLLVLQAAENGVTMNRYIANLLTSAVMN